MKHMLVLCLLPAISLYAQAPQSLTLNARLVVLDVSVTDRNGSPVDGLAAKDFQVFEDDVPQRIVSVEPPSAHLLPQQAVSAGIAAKFDPSDPAAFGRSPVTILVLDQLNTHFADSSFALRCLRDYLTAQPALLSQPAEIVSIADNGFHSLAPFTRDRDALLRALAAAPAEYAWKLEGSGKAEYGPIERMDQSLRTLELIAETNARIPGRKNLIWVGGGFPSVDPTTIDRGDAQEVKDTLRHVTDVLIDAHVTLYAVDPSSSAAGMTEITDSTQLEFAKLAGDALAGGSDPFNSSADFDRLGPLTGGRVVRARNDVVAQIAAAVEQSAHFYTIAYVPSSTSTAAAQFRRIRVTCLHPGSKTATRVGYYALPAHAADREMAAYDLTTAADSSTPPRGLAVSIVPDKAPSDKARTFIVRTSAEGLTWKPQPDGSATASVDVLVALLDRKGRMFRHTVQSATATAKRGADLQDPRNTADFVLNVPSASGVSKLRFVVRDSASGHMGSADIPLVPDR